MSQIIGVVAQNTIGYVETIFSCMEEKKIVVPLRNSDDQYRIKAAKINNIVELHDNAEQWMKRSFSPVKSDDIALIAFTSGTEGNPKGVEITHNNLAEVVQRLNTVMEVDSSIREYIGIPVYHSFGLGRCRAVASAGGAFFIPADGFNPFEIAQMLKRQEINAISAVPSLWRILLETKEVIGDYGKEVKWIEIGSQYMSREEKEALKALFPNAKIVQHYGLTEASRTTLLEIHKTVGEQLESVGKTFGDIQVKILESDQIAISGSHVATEYLIEGQSVNLKDEKGWFITNDLGEIKDGYLYYRGRADDIINCGGIKISPEQLETKIFPLLEDTTQIAICRKPDPLRGDAFLVAVTPEFKISQQKLYSLVLDAVKELGVNAANAISIIEVSELPRTASGKIQRKKLSQDFEKIALDGKNNHDVKQNSETQHYSAQSQTEGDFQKRKDKSLIKTGEGDKNERVNIAQKESPVAPWNELENKLAEIWKEVLGIRPSSIHDSFFDLGGDSLLVIQLVSKISQHFDKPFSVMAVFEAPTIAQFTKILREKSSVSSQALHVIQAQGSRPPLFFIGSTNYSRALSSKLGHEQPVYGLNIFGLQPQEGTTFESLEVKEIATQYIQEIQTIQSNGPYYLCGYCADVKVAYEMAQQLYTQGESVNFLGFIDAIWENKMASTTVQRNSWIRFWQNLQNLGTSYLFYKIQEKIQFRKRQFYLTSLNVRQKFYQMRGKQLPLKLQHTLLVKIFLKALKSYVPQPYPGQITLFVSDEWRMKSRVELERLAKGGMEVYELPGLHNNFFKEPQVSVLGEKIKDCLEKAALK